MSNQHEPGLPLVLDWDGTATERDTLHMAITHFGDVEVFDALEEEVGRRLTLDEVIAAEMATITAPFDEVVTWLLEHVRMRAGFHELIEPILEREGVRARLVANHVEAHPAGWRSTFVDGPLCAVCRERCKRAATAGLESFAYAGAGVSDRCVSLQANVRFARDGLAEWLEEQGVAYEPFVDLYDVLEALATP